MMFPKNVNRDGEIVTLLPDENIYTVEQGDSSYSGIQANEAPIKYLIEQGHKSGRPVTNVVYLCSEKVLTPILAEEMVAEALGINAGHEPMTTEGFLIARIEQYCEENGYEAPSFDPVAYDPLRPADSITAIMNVLWEDTVLSLDITGGQRDAVLLLSMIIQTIKMGTRGTSIGEVVYSNLGQKLIIRQNNTFDLIDLINAVNSFTEYGRANQLNAFFGVKKKWTTEATKKLVSAMNAFSDSLALCQIERIEDQVREIHACLRGVESTLREKERTYNLFTDAINQIDEPSWLYELGLDDAMLKLSEIDSRVKPEMAEQEGIEDQLREWQWDYVIERNELLFLTLVPTIKERFIPETSSQGSLILEIIRWCISHRMVQQALCIYREKISECLLDFGYFRKNPSFDELDDAVQQSEITDLCLNCSIDQKGVWVHQNILPGDSGQARNEKYKTRNTNIEVVPEKEKELRLIIAWYKYLHVTRNTIMHVDTDQGNYAYFFSLAFLGKDRDATPDFETLTGEMLEALLAVDHPEKVSDSEWNDARSVAGRDFKRFKQRVADGSTKLDKSKLKAGSSKSGSSLGSMLDAETQAKLAALFSDSKS